MNAVWWLIVVAAAWRLVRDAIARRQERAFMAVYSRGADGIIVGAEPIHLRGTRVGAVLLLHGYNDSPQSMRTVATALHARGWSVSVPLLPGHGRRLQDWAASGAAEWLQAARAELAALRAVHVDVAVGGLSMGGALAFILAAEETEVRAVVGFAPYVRASVPLPVLRVLMTLAAVGARYFASGGRGSVHDPAAGAAMIAYRRSTPRLVLELEKVATRARADLPRVRQPVLVVQSREDNRIPVRSAEESFAMIGATDKTLRWTSGNGHVITLDYGHELVERVASEWLDGRLAE